MKTVTYNTYKFDELSEEAQEHAIEKLRYINVEDSFWYDYEGKTGFTAKELKRMKVSPYNSHANDLLKYKNLYFDIGRGWYIQFEQCYFSDDEIARKFLRVPRGIWERVDWSFYGTRYHSTELKYEWQGDKELTKRQKEILDRAVEIFSDKMEEALKGLRDTYEYLLTDEAVKETILCNEYDFTEDGDID